MILKQLAYELCHLNPEGRVVVPFTVQGLADVRLRANVDADFGIQTSDLRACRYRLGSSIYYEIRGSRAWVCGQFHNCER